MIDFYEKYPGFNKYREKIGITVIVIYIVFMTVSVVLNSMSIADMLSNTLAIISSALLMGFYIFCILWDDDKELYQYKDRRNSELN